jgi:DNA-binding transcriptional regulator PaaX
LLTAVNIGVYSIAMGQLEKILKQSHSKTQVQKAILTAVEAVGVIMLVTVVPNTAILLKQFGYDPGRRHKEIIKRSRERLVRSKLLSYHNGFLRLTEKGTAALRSFELADYKIDKPKKWDGRWRMLVFDIAEKRRNVRTNIRRTLVHIGFIKLQQSVWVYPYDCEDLITLLKANFKIGKDLLYVIVDSIENDKHLREIFKLPKAL